MGAVIWLRCKKHGPFTLINSLFLKNIYFLSNIFFRKTSKCHSVTLRSDASNTGLLTSILTSFVKRIMHQTKVSRTPSYPIWDIFLNYGPIKEDDCRVLLLYRTKFHFFAYSNCKNIQVALKGGVI